MQTTMPLAGRLSRVQLVRLDVAVAAAYTGVLVLTAPDWPARLLAAGIGLPAALRRLFPRTVFATVTAGSALALALGELPDPLLAAAFALYAVALTEPRRGWVPTRVIAVVSVAGAAALPLAGARHGEADLVLVGVLLLGVAWTVGRAVRERRAYTALAAEQLATRAVTEERLRIARELHDVVTHGLGVITVRAGVACHVLGDRAADDPARAALRDIELAGRSALTELRRMLGVLRSEHADPAGDLDGLAGLAEQAGRAGVPVRLDVRAERLPEGLEATVYRIVQEALTNTVKHAAPARAEVTVEAAGSRVVVEVTDDGRPSGQATGGSGLAGMRERVRAYQGELTAGPRQAGGFRVRAVLPLDPEGPP